MKNKEKEQEMKSKKAKDEEVKEEKTTDVTSKEEEVCACECDGKCASHENKELESLQQENEELKNKLMYKEAEFINFRKRKDEETASMLKYANQDLILEIIKSVDNFERAIDSIKKDEEADNEKMLTGIDMIYQELKATLTKFGVVEVSDIDVPFDEKVHHAVMVESNPEKEDGTILEVMIKGYKLHDRVIRPAMVKVNQL